MPKCYRQLQVKDLPKVPTCRLEWDSNQRPSGRKAPNPITEPPCSSTVPHSTHTYHAVYISEESSVCESVDDVSSERINDGQTVDLVEAQLTNGVQHCRIRFYVYQWPHAVVGEDFYKHSR